MLDSHAVSTLGFRPTTLFGGFPYLVTRVVPTMYHIILLPDDLDTDRLVEIARLQASANALPTCLVSAADSALYIATDGRQSNGEPPRGGVVVTGRLQSCRVFPATPSLVARRLALDRFIEQATPKTSYMFGDLTKGGRPATLDETVMLAGRQPNGVPRGLARCGRCGEWRGRCLDPSPQFAGHVMDVHCRCANDNHCAACGDLLHPRKLNANAYNEADGQIWHTPGFSAFGHVCRGGVAGRPRKSETVMTPERSAAQELVYGDLNGNLVFITKERADHLAAIHRALWSSSTWREVHERMPAGAYEELLEISGATALPGFEEYYEDERRSRPGLTRDEARAEYLALSPDERRPEPGDPFEAGNIGAICDGDWPEWTEQEMLAWVPKAIQEQYGRRSFSFVSGDCLVFRPEDEDQLIAAFVAHGYACVRDDALVRRASGYET